MNRPPNGVGLLACAMFVLVVGMAICLWNDVLTRRRDRRTKQDSRIFGGRDDSRRFTILVGALALFLVVGMLYAKPNPGRSSARPAAAYPALRWITPIALTLGVLGIVVGSIRLSVTRDRQAERALQLGQAGDWPAAERHLRRLIQEKGPSPVRVNLLGLTLGVQNNWADAMKCYLEVVEAGGPMAIHARGNLAVAYWKLGRLEDAADLLAEICRQAPSNLVQAANYCVVLAELKRTDEARRQLAEVQRLRRKPMMLPKALRAQIDHQIEIARHKIESLKPAHLADSDEIA